MFNAVWRIFTDDVGIDLGTANTKVVISGFNEIISEPSVVAQNVNDGSILAVGAEAKKMLGRTPSYIKAVRPLRDGVISDFDATKNMVSYFINLAYRKSNKIFKIPRPRTIIGVPSSATEIGRKAVYDAAKSVGSREVFIIEEPMAAAIGSGLPVSEAVGSMIVDIGGGTTDIAIISLGGIVIDKTIAVAGDLMDQAIVKYVREKYNLLIGERIAEDAKINIGSAYHTTKTKIFEIRGRDLIQGVPRILNITSNEIREGISPQLQIIAEAISEALEECPPDLLADITASGIMLAGGGAMIEGIKDYFEDKTKMKFIVSEDPIFAVVKGTKKLLEDIDLLSKIKGSFQTF